MQTKVSTLHLQEMDRKFHIHPFTDTQNLANEGTLVMVKGDGIYVWDSEGKKYLDAMSGLWCVALGYGRSELADVAAQQMTQLPYYNSFFKSSVQSAISLADKLAEISPPHINHSFFTASGSEANDTVIRMVRRYWDLCGRTEKKVLISRSNAYHGSTIGGASLGGMRFMHEQGDLPIPNVVHIEQPYMFELQEEMDEAEFALLCARKLEDKIKQLGADRVAAFVAEPVQGAGGVIIPPRGYWQEVQRICRKHDVLLVVDEVICGFGRLGTWFGSDYYEVEADLMPVAKALTSGYIPLGGVLISDRVAEALIKRGKEFAHGFTYSGHPVSCAVALKNIEILENEKLINRMAEEIGPALKQKWDRLADHPIVGETRSVGGLAALELVADKKTRRRYDDKFTAGYTCRDICLNEGVIMRAVRDTMVVCPPLIITQSQLDEMVSLVRLCLDKTAARLKLA